MPSPSSPHAALRVAFTALADAVSEAVGRPVAFVLAVAAMTGWLALGPLVGWSDRWLAIFGVAVSGAAFLMLFLLQHTQNRDTRAINLKLDELLRAVEGARAEDFAGLHTQAVAELEEVEERLIQEIAEQKREEQAAP